MTDMTEAYEWQGRTIVGSDGEKLGKISDIYVDGETNRPEWMTVSSGLFGTKSNFVPLAGASSDGKDVRAQVTKDQVKDAPGVESEGQLSEEEEQRLFEHYGVPYRTDGSTTAQGPPDSGGTEHGDRGGERGERNRDRRDRGGERGTVGHDVSGPTTDDAMTRSEEEHVGTQRQEAGRARLRKHVVTEMQTRTVPVQGEDLRMHEPERPRR